MTKRINYAVMLLLLVVLGSCTAELAEEVMTADGRYVYALELEGEAQDYGGQTRALTTRSWKTGDVVYLRIASSGSTVLGTATYSGGQWTLTTESALSGSGSCQAVSVSNAAGSVSGNTLPLNSLSAVYVDKQGTWSRSGNTLKMKAVLNPVLGRLRFKGSSGTSFSLTGLTTYTAYNLSTGTFTTSQAAVTGSIGSTGYSGYIHGLMASSTSPTLQTNGYTMECPTTMMQAGESGWLNYPTASSHTGWTKEGGETPTNSSTRSFTVNGVSFTMVLVEAGTFTMGATAEQEDPYVAEKPAHQVTLTKDYYMGETEVTQGLWEAVMGQKPTSDGSQWSSTYGLGASYPAYYISWDDVQSFLTKLNSLTGQTFRMPTEAEWEYAARGGKKSLGYQYSGSNTIGDVAWYADNSGSMTHAVKTKQANELGLYDMSGNVWEWCSDWYSSSYYTSSAVTNPTGPTSGSNRVRRGGSWGNDTRACRVACRYGNSPSSRYDSLGFRLALSSSDVQSEPSDSHAYVDLGLSVKWATCNVGASSAEDYGDYYAWGETATKETYDWSTYKWCNGSETTINKYCTSSSYGTVDNKTTLESSDDVAHVKWGGTWRMPTDDEFTELRNTSNCTWTWTTQGGKNGYKVTSKKNGNSIFLPAAGSRIDGLFFNLHYFGYYWSSSLYARSDAYELDFNSRGVDRGNGVRCYGQSVRPVCP